MQKMVTLTCAVCGGTYEKRRWFADKSRFCSRRCHGTHMGRATAKNPRTWLVGNRHREGKPSTNAFAPGHATWNKGARGAHASPSTEFKRGAEPKNKAPVGTVTTRNDREGRPRAWVKIAAPNVWKLRAVIEWERCRGPVPRGHVVHHDDRDTMNDAIWNLRTLTRAEHMAEHSAELATKRRAE